MLWRRNRRILPGHCEACRYNLTGNTSGICPECGTRTAVRHRYKRRPPSRVRRIFKRSGLAVCVPLTVTWLLSMFVGFTFPLGGVRVGLGYGTFVFDSLTHPGGFEWSGLSQLHTLLWLPDGFWARNSGRVEFFPLWIPLAVVAVPTVIAWRRDRGPKPGHCRCGYDLTGNVSGMCSECGEGAS